MTGSPVLASFRAVIGACLLAAIATAADAGADDYEIDTPARVVAFGDVHGAFEDWSTLLRELEVVDAELNWIGADTHLVSLGDLIDRGPQSREVMELLIKLDEQAERAGGAVHMVLGNHEVMVMTGDLRYVAAADFAAFATEETRAERDALYAQYRRFNQDGEESVVRRDFDNRYPPGFVALRRAYSSDGALGRWLLRQPFVIRVNSKVYTHGGIASVASEESIASLNQKLQGELKNFLVSMDALREAGVMPWYVDYHDRLAFLNTRAEEFVAANPREQAHWFADLVKVFEAQKSLVFSEDSPNWYRGTAFCHPYAESFNTERFLKRVGAKQIVMGHTPTRGKVHERMEGLAIRLDTGMLTSVYKGRASALVSQGGSDYVHYLGSTKPSQPVPETRSIAQSLSGMSDFELENFMRAAPVVKSETIGTGVTKPMRVTQEMSGISNDAVFKTGDSHPGLQSKPNYIARHHNESDRYVYDVAAYKLDRLLDLQMVPTAVTTEVDGDEGVLSDWIGDAINERDRLEQQVPLGGFCKQQEQYRLRFVFDILIYNEDRNLTNILWTRNDFMLRFIDHSLAFRSTKKRPPQYRKEDLEVSDLLRERLSSLNKKGLTRELSAYLHPRQIEAILSRRDLILRQAQGTSE